jgi:DNA-binding CsgD family transcriptional regulator
VPGLYAWLRRNPRLVDGALALLLIYPGGGRLLVTLPFTLGMVVPIVFRRTYPAAAFAAVIAVGALQVLLLRRPIGADLSVLVVLYTLAAYRPRRVSLRGLAICLAGATVATWRWHPVHPVDGLYTVGVETALFGGPVLLAWLLGDSARWRRGYYQALEEKAARLERERDAQALVAAAAERARIAREIHDVVAHNVSVMVVQADGAAFALDGSPQRAREALGAISATGRRALAEMRSLLGVLRDPASRDVDLAAGPELGPQPGIDELGELLGQARAAGLPVSFTVSGVPRPVHAGDSVVAPSTTRRLIDRFVPLLPVGGPPPSDLAELTEREREVLIQVAAGLSNAEIATRLFVSEATVKTHVGRILAKLGLRDRVQAVVLAYESGLVKARGAR